MKKNYLFLVGAPKCGTSSLLRGLAQSGDVAVSCVKEPRFFTDFASRTWAGPKADRFTKTLISDWSSYNALFADRRWRVDGSTDYLSCPGTPDRLAALADKHRVKVVAVLRDPVARIISEFQHTLRDGYQSGTLAQSLAAEAERTALEWHPLFRHLARSRYAAAIRRYRALLGDNFMMLDFHTLHEAGEGLAAVADFIGIDLPRLNALPHENRSFVPRSASLNALMNADGLVNLARRVVPGGLRSRTRRVIAELNGAVYRPTQAELLHMRRALADDIAWCVADPGVPTNHWDLAKGIVAQSTGAQLPAPQRIMAEAQP